MSARNTESTRAPWRLLALLVGALLLFSTAVATAPPANAAVSAAEFEDCLLAEVNADRSASGLVTLVMARDLIDEVRVHSARMSDTTFRHMTDAERDPILPNDTTAWAENIAWSSSSSLNDCDGIHQLLMDSAPHRANLLHPLVRYFAPGVHIDGGGTWVTEVLFASPSYVPAGVGTFWDDDGSIFQAEIEKLVDAGITSGCGGGKFCPNDNVTRGQMAAFLVRALDLPSAPSAGFSDTAGTTFEANVDSLAAAGITGGCGNGRYCPDGAVTRGQMAAFLVRALDLPSAPSAGFSDTAGTTFEANIDSLAAAGITSGCGDDRYCPDAKVTRGQMAAFLVRALDL